MPHLDDMHCKHCGALVALIARASIKNKFGVECSVCKVVTIIWPIQKVYTERRQEAVA